MPWSEQNLAERDRWSAPTPPAHPMQFLDPWPYPQPNPLCSPGAGNCEHDGPMDELLQARLGLRRGVIRSRDLPELGIDYNAIRTLTRAGVLTRVRAGVYVDGALSKAASAADRHVLATRAVTDGLAGYAASHVSAALVWGLPALAADLGPVHLSGVGRGRPRRSGIVRYHPAVPAAWVVEHDGIPVVAVRYAVLQTAADSGPRAGLIAADAACRLGLTAPVALERAWSECHWPRWAGVVPHLASPDSESPGESWCRLVFHGLGIEQPEQQAEIRDELGRLVGRTDFLFRARRLVVEFDGSVKYAGASGREALVGEKRREDELRRLGYRVVRLTWADLRAPARVARLLGI
jgi:hypothetical protein